MTLDATIIVTASIAAVAPTVLALATWRQSRSNSVKADSLIVKTDEIHELTNSRMTAMTTDLAAANSKIDELRSVVAALKPTDAPPRRKPASPKSR